ncbi:hypothetical protein MPER_13606, partial [Moniliophthora perniciosa FA553]
PIDDFAASDGVDTGAAEEGFGNENDDDGVGAAVTGVGAEIVVEAEGPNENDDFVDDKAGAAGALDGALDEVDGAGLSENEGTGVDEAGAAVFALSSLFDAGVARPNDSLGAAGALDVAPPEENDGNVLFGASFSFA